MPAILTEDLCKTFRQLKKAPGIWGGIRALFSRERTLIHAVSNVNLKLDHGELVGFLGPNGAGKTTTIKILTGILYPTSGRASVLGFDPFRRNPRMLSQIALVMGNRQQLWWDLPAWDSFAVLREIYAVDRASFQERLDYLLESLQLTDKLYTQVRKLSLGERMKCEIVAALLHRPKVLFLDEPTIGLDVVSQKRIRDFLREINRDEGCTILLTSHYMQDVQELCRRVVLIDKGTVMFDGTLDALTAEYSDSRRLRLTFAESVDRGDLEKFGQVVEENGTAVVLAVQRAETAKVTGRILQSLPVVDIAVEEVSVDEVVRDLFSRERST